jgi:hypothetical protein
MSRAATGLRYGMGGAAAGALAMIAVLAFPPVDPPGAAPIRTRGADGQLVERFEIRPADIIAHTSDGSLGVQPFPARIEPVGGPTAGSSVLTAKLRNARGAVIGVASRYTLTTDSPDQPDRLWTLVITRRGTLATTCPADAATPCGSVLGGTGTFAVFRGRLEETARGAGYVLALTGTGER